MIHVEITTGDDMLLLKLFHDHLPEAKAAMSEAIPEETTAFQISDMKVVYTVKGAKSGKTAEVTYSRTESKT